MRFPQNPPDWHPLMDGMLQSGKVAEFFRFGQQESQRHDRYLHWDEFRHRASSAEGLTLPEQWAAIRFNRSTRSQPVPLVGINGKPFTYFLTQKAFEILHEIDLHCGGAISVMEDGLIQKDTRDRYYVNSILEEALTSSQLEGAVVTRSEARELIRRQQTPSTEHERMVVNNFRTMRMVSELKQEALTPDLILRIHGEITRGTMENPEDEGRIRAAGDDVRIEDEESGEVMHTPPDASLLAARMEALCEFANEPGMKGFLHPVVRSIVLHFWIAYDHPFVDGNGRTARALFYWSMLRHGFWLAEFFSISHEILKAPKKYYRAFLYTETDDNDLNYFILHQLGVIRDSISALQGYIRRKQEEVESLRRSFGAGGDFNSRQLALLKHALKNPFTAYTVVSHQNSHGISNQTAKNDLVALEARGLLQRSKSGRAFTYAPVANLAERLEELNQGQPGK